MAAPSVATRLGPDLDAALRTVSFPQPRAEYDALVDYYLAREVAEDDAVWQENLTRYAAKIRSALDTSKVSSPGLFGRLVRLFYRTDPIRQTWDKQWLENIRLQESYFVRPGSPADYEWGSRRLQMRNAGGTLARILLLANVIQALKPRFVLEVGSGDGLNLFLLAPFFPEIEFHGVELTPGGVAVAKQFQREPLPQYAAAPLAHRVKDPAAVRRVQFREGTAAKLKERDGAYDLVITCVALEQMESIRKQALGEVARVSRRWTALVEPFRDFNADGMRRDYIVAYNYFAGTIAELPEHGLEPVYVCADVPQKLNLHAGLVVCRKKG